MNVQEYTVKQLSGRTPTIVYSVEEISDSMEINFLIAICANENKVVDFLREHDATIKIFHHPEDGRITGYSPSKCLRYEIKKWEVPW